MTDRAAAMRAERAAARARNTNAASVSMKCFSIIYFQIYRASKFILCFHPFLVIIIDNGFIDTVILILVYVF